LTLQVTDKPATRDSFNLYRYQGRSPFYVALKDFSFLGTSSPNPLPGLRFWTPFCLSTRNTSRRLYLFCSLAVLDPRVGHTETYFLHLPLSSVVLTDSSTVSPVHVLMLSIHAVCGLPRLRAPGIVPCIITFSRQLPCFLVV